MNKITILIFLFLFNHLSFAQDNLEYTLNLEFQGNIYFGGEEKFEAVTNIWKLQKFETSCKFANIEYVFKQKDTLLLRYFKELKDICSRKELNYFYGNINNKWSDGEVIRGWFKSDSIDKAFGYSSGYGKANPLQIKVFANFFNIALYILSQPSSTDKLSRVQLSSLNICELYSNSSHIHLVSFDPLTYRLNDSVDEKNSEKIKNLFNNLPDHTRTYFEVGILFFISPKDSIYPFFREFLKSHKKIIWIPDNEKVVYKLKSLGVKKKNIQKIRKINKHSA